MGCEVLEDFVSDLAKVAWLELGYGVAHYWVDSRLGTSVGEGEEGVRSRLKDAM